jgi:polysaccharide export outer membrane protein
MSPRSKLDRSLYSPPGTIASEGKYVIGVRDQLEIIVWRCPELDTETRVRPEDGMVTVPLIGDVKAAGKTPKELAKAISGKMGYYVKDPRIAVGVKKFGNKKVFIMGQVLKPGVFEIERGDRIMDVLARAGGFNDNAIPSCTYIIRGGYEDPEIVRVNLARLLHKGDISQNVYLMESDIVYVPESEIENLNYALRKVFPSLYFAEQLSTIKRNIMTGGYDFNEVFKRGDRGF